MIIVLFLYIKEKLVPQTHTSRVCLKLLLKNTFCRDDEYEVILNWTLLISSIPYQSIGYCKALSKASSVSRQSELNFHSCFLVYSLIHTKYIKSI